MQAITTHNLTKKYGKKTVVNHINLSVKKGIIFGFLGRNGAGKSTFINMMTGLAKPTSGSFEILGHQESARKDIQRKMGVLPDYSSFYENDTALDHLTYFSKILQLSLSKEELRQTLIKVGLEDAANVKIKNFSFGMKKKLGIAQAIMNQPEILFLDEPTSGVDANSVLTIHALIKEIASTGTTIFLTSHNLDEVEKLCDEVAIMNKGVIQTKGNMDQLRAQYQQNIAIYIKHSILSENQQIDLKKELSFLAESSNITSTYSELFVKDEKVIPEINRILVNNLIDVYRIEVDQPSLEEIFLHLGEDRESA
ncbi:ABC transporter ATP-binding protein [Oceanobacillus halophilus]|uniref:ABC transporter ATP-binding protein n=1 Tax=Oceanobacillus halophilus TaxID=930130 RepID=A0A494ZV03_9BACI|nr:ABC transporter ATP-binding protein [Oceanobacillus halophilus]RKQ30248.1 ABC transporter ATP-binding protein [Oceanobacillus halophilus]